MALGADRGVILTDVLREAGAMTLAGVLLGLPLAYALTKLVSKHVVRHWSDRSGVRLRSGGGAWHSSLDRCLDTGTPRYSRRSIGCAALRIAFTPTVEGWLYW